MSRKLAEAQRSYTTAERELLSIVKSLKECRTMLLGHKVVACDNHLDLLNPNNNSPDRLQRCRLILEECGVQLKHTKGDENVVTDAFSRMEIHKASKKERQQREALKC